MERLAHEVYADVRICELPGCPDCFFDGDER
jgi:hypothetical protein